MKVVTFVFALFFCTSVYAQSALVGKYSGTFMAPNNRNVDTIVPLEIEIASAEDGKLKGTITNSRAGICGREPRQTEGTYDGNNLKVVQTGANRTQGCDNLVFEGVASGNKLTGKLLFNGALKEVTLSK